MRYPITYEESYNTVLVQEIQKYNRLLNIMKHTLVQVQKALVGQVVMSKELEAVATSLYNQWIPQAWEDAPAFPSLKPLGAWTQELLDRLSFLQNWINDGIPVAFWISGFFFPQAFLTGTKQNFARKYFLPIDTIDFDFIYKDKFAHDASDIPQKPEDGCYVYGLYLEAARWDATAHTLTDPRPKELFSTMPVLHLNPKQSRPYTLEGIYRCPVYKILTRTGMLSTTGHR